MNNAPAVPLPGSKSKSSYKNRSPILVGLLISFVTLVICLGGTELAGFLWERNTAQGPQGWTLVASRRLTLEPFGSPDRIYYKFKPNLDYVWEGIPVHINSRGFRTEEFQTPKPAGVYRILNLGDSIAFGWEVRQEQTYGKLLERKLNERGDGVRYEVINAAIPAWNPGAECDFFSQEGVDYQPDLVIFDLTIVNDIFGQGPAISSQPSLFQFLRDHTYGWPFLTTETRYLLSKKFGPEAIPVLNPPKNPSAYFPLIEDSPVWDRLWESIQEVYNLAEERNVDLTIVAFPTAYQLNNLAHPDTPQQVLGKRADEAQIEFVDLLPVYRDACAQAKPGACEGFENLLFADVWMHPNPYGHNLAAEALLKAEVLHR